MEKYDDSTEIFINPFKKVTEMYKYNGYKICYLQSDKGYNFGSLFAIPEDTLDEKVFSEMIVRQNKCEENYNEKQELSEDIKSQFQCLVDDARETKAPVFMPILPSDKEIKEEQENKNTEEINLQDLEIENANKICSEYSNINKQIINAFDAVRFQISRLTQKDVPEKWFLYGRQETSKGLLRLWSLCPQRTSAICCDNNLDNIVLPIMMHKGEQLNYPDGFGNYKELTGIDGDNQELLDQYRNTDVLYIGNSIDVEKQKHEEQFKTKLKKLKFTHINIERYNGTNPVDVAYFYQYRSSIYKKTLLEKFLNKIMGKKEETLLLLANNSSNYVENIELPFGQLTEEEKEEYARNLQGKGNRKSSAVCGRERLARVMSNNVSGDKSLGE